MDAMNYVEMLDKDVGDRLTALRALRDSAGVSEAQKRRIAVEEKAITLARKGGDPLVATLGVFWFVFSLLAAGFCFWFTARVEGGYISTGLGISFILQGIFVLAMALSHVRSQVMLKEQRIRSVLIDVLRTHESN